MIRIGPHLSVSKGFPRAVQMARALDANTFQFFTRNPRGSASRNIPESEIEDWSRSRREHDIFPAVGHIPYTVNLASPKERAYEFARMVLAEDWFKCHRLGAEYLVTHPGTVGDSTRTEGLARIVKAVNDATRDVMDRVDETRNLKTLLLLETMAGAGRELGGDFGELGAVIAAVDRPEYLGICFDTCHAFAAGWDLRRPDGIDECLRRLDAAVGLDRVKAVHLNDSRHELGSRKDRHACLGQGHIGEDGIRVIVNHEFLRKLPFLLETPVESVEDWAAEIRLVRSLTLS